MKNNIRIIAGQWRGHKLSFANRPTLRPTPDRVRETLFNWLQYEIEGMICLDLFAGSGALGFEALSRGAQWVDFIDTDPLVIKSLQQNQAKLKTQNCHCYLQNALTFLKGNTKQYDLIFLDPPYQDKILPEIFIALEKNNLLKNNSYIYAECVFNEKLTIPEHWQPLKEKVAGEVGYYLFQRKN